MILFDDDSAQPEGSKNADIIAANNGMTGLTVQLVGRTLYKDGSWNTLCLPFDVDLTATDGPLFDGATVETLESTSFDSTTGTLTLNFSDNVTSIEAGKPYLVKWNSGSNVTNPVFNDVVISSSLNPVVTTTTGAQEGTEITFAGAFSPIHIDQENHELLYLGANNTLYYPNAPMTIGSCRAHFRLKGITIGDPSDPTNNVRALILNFEGDETTTGISTTNFTNDTNVNSDWYSLNGRKLSGKPTKKGVYILNGRKRVVK